MAEEPYVKAFSWNDIEPERSTNEPSQLAVVHGLVLDRIQQLKRGVVMFGSRCSPISYGIVCDLIYDADKHMGEPVRQDPRDNRLYAVDQIEWIVLQVSTLDIPLPFHGTTLILILT
jgi:hypothetical protein